MVGRVGRWDRGETPHLIPLATVGAGPANERTFPHLLSQSANNAGVRDLASGGWLNGSEQTAGAGEQTEQQHQKAKGVNR